MSQKAKSSKSKSEVALPQGLERYNAQFQNFPKGEIKHEKRERGARHISWLFEYRPTVDEGGKIYFYADNERYGGPVGFLSNFFECEFTLPKEHETHKFRSVEQAYQFRKACIIAKLWEKFSDKTEPSPMSSKRLPAALLNNSLSSNELAQLGRVFSDHPDRIWVSIWKDIWADAIPGILKDAVSAKFKQNQDLKELLLMTGNFELLEASDNDGSCGIGFRAANVTDVDRTRYGANMLRRALIEVRDELCEEEPGWPTAMAFDYFHKYYELVAKLRSGDIDIETEDAACERIEGSKAAWVAERGEDSRLATPAAEITQPMNRKANADGATHEDAFIPSKDLGNMRINNGDVWVFQHPYTLPPSDERYNQKEKLRAATEWFSNDAN